MFQVLHKILSVIIALVVLFTSLSFTIEKHICEDEIMDVSVITNSDYCDMHDMDNNVNGHDEKDDQCCVENINLIPGNKNVQEAINHLEINQVKFILAFNYTYLDLFEKRENIVPFTDTSPFIVDKDLQILYQTFLI